MEQKLKKILQYFSFFNYSPTFEEIHTFFPTKITKKEREKLLKTQKYTVGEYSKKISNVKNQISKRKINSPKFKIYIKLLSFFPQIKLIGLSGSIAMMNADLDDDIDLFIITKKKRLFTGRFLATIFAFIMGLKRKIGQKKAPGKVCLNLFFDESDLTVPNHKKTEFVAHEILQMKPIINKNNIYERFLQENKWVLKLFPNATVPVIPAKAGIQSKIITFSISNKIESFLKNLQLRLINRHRTTEIVTDSQLWFHPDDFGKKIKA